MFFKLSWPQSWDMRCLFVYPLGKSASEAGKLLGAVNETRPENSKMHAKTNEQSAVEDPNLGDDNNGNTQVYFNITNKRLERLEKEERDLKDQIKNIRGVQCNISDAELMVSAFKWRSEKRIFGVNFDINDCCFV